MHFPVAVPFCHRLGCLSPLCFILIQLIGFAVQYRPTAPTAKCFSRHSCVEIKEALCVLKHIHCIHRQMPSLPCALD